MKEYEEKPDKMAVMPMKKLVMSMGLPIMTSMLVQAFYNVVDSLYVSHMADTAVIANVSDKAVQALALAFPIQMLMIAFNTGTGVGICAVLSRFRGQGDRESASRVAGNAIFLAIIYIIAFTFFGVFGVSAFISSQTSDPVTAAFGISYLRVITIFCFGQMGFFAYEKILQAAGKATLAMIMQLSGSVANIILDPIFIFGFYKIPAMGVEGAAVATVISQCVSLAMGIFVHYTRNDTVNHSLRYVKPSGRIISAVYVIGIPAIIMSAMTSVMAYGVNRILGAVSASLVTAFGIYYKLQNFVFMPAFGLNNALIPIVGFSYGARDKVRIKQALRWGLTDVFVIMGVGILIMQLFAPQISSLFAVSEEVRTMTEAALRIISLGYLFAGANVILQGYCQALGNGVYSLLISLLRMAVVLLPLIWIFVKTGHSGIVWISFPFAEAAALIFAVFAAILLTRKRFMEI